LFFEAELLGFTDIPVPLSVPIFLFHSIPQKGFPLQSGLVWKRQFFVEIFMKMDIKKARQSIKLSGFYIY